MYRGDEPTATREGVMSDILGGLVLWLCLACSFGALCYLLLCDDDEPIEEDERAPCADDPLW